LAICAVVPYIPAPEPALAVAENRQHQCPAARMAPLPSHDEWKTQLTAHERTSFSMRPSRVASRAKDRA
jgi:hypothetical protein